MVTLRPIKESDKAFLWDMLFEMVFIPAGEENPGKEVLLKLPEISKYLDGFSLSGSDSGFGGNRTGAGKRYRWRITAGNNK